MQEHCAFVHLTALPSLVCVQVIRAYRDHLRKVSKDQRLIPLVLDSYDGAAFLSFGALWWDTER